MSQHAEEQTLRASRIKRLLLLHVEPPAPDKRAIELDVAQHGGHVGGVALVLRGLGGRYGDVQTPERQRHVKVPDTQADDC